MVTLKIYGRTGNQLMMISTALAYSLKYNLPYHIPAHTINDEAYPPAFTNLENPDYDPTLEKVQVKEAGRPYFEIPFFEEWRDKNIELDGYWQSVTYFDEYRTEILKILGFTDYQRGFGGSQKLWAEVHWRIGDFKLYPTKHPIVTEAYMKKAMDELMDRTAIRAIYVHSDNIEECQSFFKNEWSFRWHQCKFCFMGIGDTGFYGKTPLEQIKRMSQSGAHIISNSTYSWFSAWANEYKYKTVICPHEDNWYGPDNKHIDVSLLIPKDWIRIKF